MVKQADKKRVGVLGGTFDPVHLAHVEIARLAFKQAQLSSLVFVPCHLPPHRDLAHAEDFQRLKMLEIALADESGFSISDYELNKKSTSYTVETLEYLAEIYPDAELVFCMGGDSLASFTTWHRWQDILERVNLIVLDRDGSIDKLEQAELRGRLIYKADELSERSGQILRLDALSLDVSATLIRTRLAGLSAEGYEALLADTVLNKWLNKDVLKYICDNHIYS